MKVKLQGGATAPKYAKDGDAGLDLCSRDHAILYPGEKLNIGTGVHVAIPRFHVGLLVPRSGLGGRGLTLRNTVGVIDSGYRGEVIAMCVNNGEDPISIQKGERFAQLVVVPFLSVPVEVVDELDSTERGETGFGSSGQ